MALFSMAYHELISYLMIGWDGLASTKDRGVAWEFMKLAESSCMSWCTLEVKYCVQLSMSGESCWLVWVCMCSVNTQSKASELSGCMADGSTCSISCTSLIWAG